MNDIYVERAEALFVSGLDPAEHRSDADIRHAVGTELIVGGCPARMAQEFGDHPELAARRMCWCRDAVKAAYAHCPA